MHNKKHHIVRKTIIVISAFALGVVGTVIAAATYDANVQARATKMFATIKSNASTLATADQQAYYTLVHLNIQSLIQVLTSVDSSLMLELGTTPDLEDDVVINQITNTGATTTSTNTNTNTNTTTNTNNTGTQSGSSQQTTTNTSSNSGTTTGSTGEQRITLNVPSGMLACGNPERNDYTTYSPVDRKVIIQKDYCNSKGGYVWVVCSGKVTNTKSISAISNNDTFSCPVVTTTPNTSNNPPVTTTSNTNTFIISANHTNNNSIKVDYNIPTSTGYKTCVITVGTTAEMITISNGSAVTGNGMSSGLGSSEVGFSGSKYYGIENDLYLNLYCSKLMNAKYTDLEKVITTTRLGSLVTAPISNISVTQIPGNTVTPTPGTTTTNTGTSTYIATNFESSVPEAKLGDTISLIYSVSTDRTCNVVLLKNGQLIREGLPAGTSGTIRYDLKSSDLNTTTSSVDFEMQCSNGSRKTRSIKIINQGGVTPGTTSSVAYINIVDGGGLAACNKQIFDKFGTQKYSCSIGGGCTINGQPKTATNLSANPNLPGVCILKSEWDSATPVAGTTPTTTQNSGRFSIAASVVPTNNSIKLDYNIPASTGYKTCLITVGTTAEMITISNGSTVSGNGMSSGLGSSEVGFNGSKYYGNENNLYFNLYCSKLMNAKYVEMEKVVPTTRLSNIITAPISTMSVSQIPGNTATATTPTSTTPVPTITANKTTATAGDTVTFTWTANDPAPVFCRTITNNVTQAEPYLQGASGTIPVTDVPVGSYAIKIECKYSSGYIRTSPVINVLVNATPGTVASVAPTCNDPVKYYQYYNPDVPADQGLIHWYKYGYKEQRKSCWPAPLSCAAGGPASWGTNCSGSWSTTVSGSDARVIDNIAPGIGEYKATCINGSWTNAVFSCN